MLAGSTPSPNCLKGYQCQSEDDKHYNCKDSTLRNTTENETIYFCYKFTYDSSDALIKNLATSSGLFLLISKINAFLFQFSFQLSNLRCIRRLRESCCNPSRFFIPHVIIGILFWLILPYFELSNINDDIFRPTSFLRQTKFQAIYTMTIATFAIAGQTALSVSDVNKSNYLVYTHFQ